MPKFNIGYPTRTGDDKKDLQNLFDFVMEMADRISYILNGLPETKEDTTE